MLPSLHSDAFFQQDGAPTHYCLEAIQSLDKKLPDSWIGKEGSFRWPAHIPDLTALDFLVDICQRWSLCD